MTAPDIIRAFVIGPSDAFVEAVRDLLQAGGVDAAGDVDPRGVKRAAASGHLHALLIAESIERPRPAQLATALKQALEGTAMIVITRDVRSLEEGSPFHAAIKFPVGASIFASAVRRAVATQSRTAPDPRDMQAEIELRSARLQSQNYYEVLGVGRHDSSDRIKAAYDLLSLSFHPDRLRALDDDSRAQAMTLYLRIGDAYRTLRDPNERMRYDSLVDAGGGSGAPQPSKLGGSGPQSLADLSTAPNARKYLDLAQRALIAGNQTMALVQLRFASTLDPENALIINKISELETENGAR